ncbi:hypothetical protein AA16663_2180 [Komagataeibacter rhaeticus DSM 16663]|nr:hypothetical protein AA16663_2180 [Komagataeibacter rhaeticus DSM 16663]
MRLRFRQAQFGLFTQLLLELYLVAQLVGLATVLLLGMHGARGRAAGAQGLVFDAHVTVLHEFAAALHGFNLPGGALLPGLAPSRAARGRGLALAHAFKRLAESGFIDFFALRIALFFFGKGKKIVIR